MLPVTRRAELVMGRAAGASPAPSSPGAQAGGLGSGGLYLMASERSTGQPPPPEGVSSQRGPSRAEAPGRIAIGLSGA
ncbi:MAG: hypothetical protein M0005_00515 [Actinomycetota bacterium]|nr:hypothetical protein [Actinomycetota bacterium]